MSHPTSTSGYLHFLHELILSAGALSLEFRENLAKLQVSAKNGSVRDLVSDADEGVEAFIRAQIAAKYPEHKFLGEESGESENFSPKDFRWVVDPIDGTVNFIKGGPFYNISIALQQGQETLLGAVFAPVLGELFWAEKGGGAFKAKSASNFQEPETLQVRPLENLNEAVLITGFGCLRAGIQPNNYLYLGHILPHISDIRRFGAGALDLCYVAAGIYDGYWELALNIYDLAAACLILEEAGGKYSDLYGGMEDFPSSVLGSNPVLHAKLLEILGPVEKPYNGFRSLLN